MSAIPFDRMIWSGQECAGYLGQSYYTFMRKTRFLPGFPSESPTVARRWQAKAVMEWKPDNRSRSTSLYRHFDKDGALLYVGISLSAIRRMGQHRMESRWFDRVATIKVEHFATREEARTAERAAIKSENPKFNVKMKNGTLGR